HDSFFRSLLADSQMAMGYFKSTLPERIIRLLDLTTLERVPDSYVSGELEKTMSDVVYRCRRRDGKGSVSILPVGRTQEQIGQIHPGAGGRLYLLGLPAADQSGTEGAHAHYPNPVLPR